MFGKRINEIRIKKGLSLREANERLKVLTIESYSKIEREIQNPYDKEEFLDIINALDIKDSSLINELEKLAMNCKQPKKMSEKEIVERFPVNFSNKVKIGDDFCEKMKKMIIEAHTPTHPSKTKKSDSSKKEL